MRISRILLFALTSLLVINAAPAWADEATVAVAANFAEVMQKLKPVFEIRTGHHLQFTVGSTGSLYAQVKNGAPFDAMLAADQRRPKLLEHEGNAVPGSRFTYAIGKLTLWSPKPGVVANDGTTTLKAGEFHKLAIANPKLAPYGAAARDTMQALGLYASLKPKLAMGSNIGQTFTMVSTGNAELGFVALSYVLSSRNAHPGSRWDVPQSLYKPIRQDAILTRHGENNTAAKDFLAFLKSPEATAIIKKYGYQVEDQPVKR